MRQAEPDVFIHCGDTIYADQPLRRGGEAGRRHHLEERRDRGEVEGGGERRRLPRHLPLQPDRRAHAPLQRATSQIVQWDDHEVPRQLVSDARSVRGQTVHDQEHGAHRRARAAGVPRVLPDAGQRRRSRTRLSHRATSDRSVEIFALDLRSYRGPNTREPPAGAATEAVGAGRARRSRLAQGAASPPRARPGRSSPATCRSASSCRTRPPYFEAVANGDDGPPLGRELEIADLLAFIKDAAHAQRRVDHRGRPLLRRAPLRPDARAFTDFDPFWEFVAGPLHAGTFGPNKLDPTFGPEVSFVGIPPGMKPNRPPCEGFQFFGPLRVDRRTKAMTVTLHDLAGKAIFSQELGVVDRESVRDTPCQLRSRCHESSTYRPILMPNPDSPRNPAFLRALKRNNDREWFKARQGALRAGRDASRCSRSSSGWRSTSRRSRRSWSRRRRCRCIASTATRGSAATRRRSRRNVAANFPWRGLHRHQGAGLYFEVAPAWVWIGGGMYAPEPPQLVKVREHIADTCPGDPDSCRGRGRS